MAARSFMSLIASCINSMYPSGGSELHAVRTTERLVERGYRMLVLTFDGSMDGMYARYQRVGAPVFAFPVTSLVGAGALRRIIDIASFLKTRKVDLVVTHDVYTNFLMTIAARIARVPVIASKRYTQYALRRHRYTDFIAFHLATSVLANSQAVAKSIQLERQANPRDIHVVPNFVDDEVFAYTDGRDQIARLLGVPSGGTVFGIVAQLRPEKNHPVLLEAFKALTTHRKDVQLVIVGDGPERNSIAERVKLLGLDGVVTLTGHMSNAWRAYRGMDIALLPSAHEGFPNSLIEAMALGTPVIASSVGGITDVVVDGATGLLVPPGDAVALTAAMNRLAEDKAYRMQLGEAAREVARNEFSAAAVLPRLESLFQKVMSQ